MYKKAVVMPQCMCLLTFGQSPMETKGGGSCQGHPTRAGAPAELALEPGSLGLDGLYQPEAVGVSGGGQVCSWVHF